MCFIICIFFNDTQQKLQLKRVDVGTRLDTDVGEAAESRRRLLEKAAEEGVVVLSRNAEFPGLGFVTREKDGDGFEWRAVRDGHEIEGDANNTRQDSGHGGEGSDESQCEQQ